MRLSSMQKTAEEARPNLIRFHIVREEFIGV